MSQPHPPIPEPHPQPDGDEPRTQSILLPPSQRPGSHVEDPSSAPGEAPPTAPVQEWSPAPTEPPSAGQPQPGAGQFTQPGTAQFARPTHDPAAPPQGAGPMGFVPGFASDPPAVRPAGSTAVPPPPPPGPATGPGTAPPSAAAHRSPLTTLRSAGRGSTVLLSVGLAVLALALLQLGLALDYGNRSLWDVVPTWSAFATVAAVLVLASSVATLTGWLPARTAWRVGAVGLAGLAAAWVLVALPLAASDRGFWLTAAVAAAGAASWLAPGRAE